jgi:PAS domain S-box-containing protein
MRETDTIQASVGDMGPEISRLLSLQAEIGISLLSNDSLSQMLRRCTEVVVEKLDAAFARIWTLNSKENVLELQASAGLYTHLDGPHSRVPVGKFKIGLIAQERKPHLTNCVVGDPRVSDQDWAKRAGMVSFAGYPLIVEDRLVGILAMFSRKALPDNTLIALSSVANQIALGIERKQIEVRERQQTAEAIAANAKFRAVFDQTTVFAGIMTAEGIVVDANRLCLEACGYRADEVLGRLFWETGWWRNSPETQEKIRAATKQASQGNFYREVLPYVWADGTEHTVDFALFPIKDAEGRIMFLHPTGVDITDLKQAELQQKLNFERFRTMADAMPQMVWTARADGFVDYYNQRWFDYTGLTFEETQGWGWKQTQHPDDVQRSLDMWSVALAKGEVFEIEMRFLRASDKTWRWHFTRAVPVRDDGGRVIQWVGTCTDIDDRKVAEEVARDAAAELERRVAERTVALREEISVRQKAEQGLRQLTGRLLTLRDDERRRIARDLHDSAGQLLTATTMSLAVAGRDASVMSPAAVNALTEASNLVQQTMKEVRIVSHLLHPPLLDEAGLGAAIREYLEGFSKRGDIEVELIVLDDFGRLPVDLETAVFRVIQECLTNVHRHSGSKTAKVELSRTANEVRVEVADKGRGIETQKPAGVGLRGMRERVAQFGGQLEVSSNESGTAIVAKLPIPEESTK